MLYITATRSCLPSGIRQNSFRVSEFLKLFSLFSRNVYKACYFPFSVTVFLPWISTICSCCFQKCGNAKMAWHHYSRLFRVFCSLEKNAWNTFHAIHSIASQSNGCSGLFCLFLLQNRVNQTHPNFSLCAFQQDWLIYKKGHHLLFSPCPNVLINKFCSK